MDIRTPRLGPTFHRTLNREVKRVHHPPLRRGLSMAAWHGCAIAILLALASCGGRRPMVVGERNLDGGSSDAMTAGPLICKPFSACGGDVFGTWTVVSECFDAEVEQFGCQTVDYRSSESTGSYTFSDEGWAVELASTVRFSLTEPTSCVGPGATCDSIQADIERQFSSSSETGTAACSSQGSDCRCVVVANSTDSGSGTLTTAGNSLTLLLDPQSGTRTTFDYCVEGDTLTLHQAGGGGTFVRR